MARPSKLTPEMQEAIVQNMAKGLPLEYACRAAGITSRTARAWFARGRSKRNGPHFDFLQAIKKAEALLMGECLDAVKGGSPGWQSRAWLLERKWPELWSTDREMLQELKKFLKERRRVEPDPKAGEAPPA